MGWTDWIISLGLIALVVRQLRERRLTTAGLLWPVGLVVWAAIDYLRAIPDQPGDLILTSSLTAIGVALGISCAALTRVHIRDTDVLARATGAAAALWILGMGSRLAFGLFSTHGGEPTIARLSTALHLHSQQTWATALIATALGEVLSRTTVLTLKLRHSQAAINKPPSNRRPGDTRTCHRASAESETERSRLLAPGPTRLESLSLRRARTKPSTARNR